MHLLTISVRINYQALNNNIGDPNQDYDPRADLQAVYQGFMSVKGAARLRNFDYESIMILIPNGFPSPEQVHYLNNTRLVSGWRVDPDS